MNLSTKQEQTHRLGEQIYSYQGRKVGWRTDWEFGMDMYTLLYLTWITNKDLLSSTWSSVQCYVASWMEGQCGGERTHVYIWLSPFPVHLKLSQHCYSAILQYKIKRFFFFLKGHLPLPAPGNKQG